MEHLSNVFRVSLPNYLTNLPIPKSIGGWFHLSCRDWVYLVPFVTVVGGISYLSYDKATELLHKKKRVNPSIKKENPKVVDSINAEDVTGKTAFCRCWRSTTFPYCDGSHNAYNKEAGDNVGPLIIVPKKE